MVSSVAAGESGGNLHSAETPRAGFFALMLGSIGVVYGDIGTSPLYAVRESVTAAVGHGNPATEEAVLGILSLIIWALFLVVTVKYVIILLRADNKGEGGTLALMALAHRAVRRGGGTIILLGIVSAALFYGDALITPALSVLSAVEGLKIVTPAFEPYVVPLAVLIMFALFAVQSHGTEKVARFFGPITLVWFIALAAAGLYHIGDNPSVLRAFNPVHGVSFVASHGMIGLLTLGAVFLVVTGAEALYADLGHFGKKPIRMAWLTIVLPALIINYLGQGALVLANPKAIENPFFLLYPEWAILPMVALATAATVIASQAVITGAYSITSQAIQLGLLPRLEIRHTSESQFGQIYMPRVNMLAAHRRARARADVPLVQRAGVRLRHLGDRHHGGHGADGLRGHLEASGNGRRSRPPRCDHAAVPVPGRSRLPGRQPAQGRSRAAGSRSRTWRRRLIAGHVHVAARQPAELFEKIAQARIRRYADLVRDAGEASRRSACSGTAVFLTGDPDSAPTALMHSLKHYKVLHEQNVILTVEDRTRRRASIRPSGSGWSRSTETFSARWTLRNSASWSGRTCRRRSRSHASSAGTFDVMSTSFFLSRRDA
jgi:KUP system potassium uptake protein